MSALHPQCALLIEALQAQGLPTIDRMSPAEARAGYRSRGARVQPEAPAVARIEDVMLPIGSRHLGLRLYRPIGSADDARLPALVFLHGGGWLLGDLDTHDTLCRELCNGSGACVVAVDYRLAPEHPYPAALDDARAVLDWVFENADDAFIDASHVAIGGDSAGGNLAAILAIEARDAGRNLAFQLLVYPALDLRCDSDSHVRNGDGFVLTHAVMTYFVRQYAGTADLDDWRLSPARCASLAGVAPALVLVAGFDPLHDEGVAHAQRLSAAGVPTTLMDFGRQIHGFLTMGKVIDEANDAVLFCAAALRRAFAIQRSTACAGG